jgi:proteasome accessory factor B
MHPLERLLNLVILLLETPRPLTFEQIRDKLTAYGHEDPASGKRMFERDKDALRDLGIPVEVSGTDAWDVDEGYRIPKDRYYLPEIAFTPEEISSLVVAAQAPGEDDAEQAVRKLQAGIGASVLSGIAERPVVAGEVAGPRLVPFTDAIERRRTLRFRYRPATGDPGERHVDPYSLVWRAGHWYLIGLDRDRGEIRSYRVSRVEGEPADAGEGSAPPEGFDARAHLRLGPWGAGEPEEQATLAFSPRVAWWALQGVPGAEIREPGEDGWIRATVPAGATEVFLSWILSFGPDAELVAPTPLRDEVVRRLEAVVASG